MIATISRRRPRPCPSASSSVVAAARIEVSGVRNSCVSESISAVRSRSPSRAASMRAEASIAIDARDHNGHLRAHRRGNLMRKLAGRQPNAPTGRSPSISGLARQIAGNRKRRVLALCHRPQAGLNAHRQIRGRGVKLVLVADIEHHSIQREDAIDHPRQIADQPGRILVEHHLLAQRVEPLHVFAPLLGLPGLAACPLRHPAYHQATGHKREHRDPLLRAGQPKRVVRKQKEVVEGQRAEQRDIKREADPGLGGRPHHQHQKDHARGGRVGAQPDQHKRGRGRHRVATIQWTIPRESGESFHYLHHTRIISAPPR